MSRVFLNRFKNDCNCLWKHHLPPAYAVTVFYEGGGVDEPLAVKLCRKNSSTFGAASSEEAAFPSAVPP
jgi:hypothetical protein